MVLAQAPEEPSAFALTVVGAEASANESKSIPKYQGSRIAPPKGWQPGEHYADPFSADEMLFRIDAGNVQHYQDQLGNGQKKILALHKNYNLPVYQSRRTATYPPFIAAGTQYNANNAKLNNDGNGLQHFRQGFPFPVLAENSQTAALQALWNHIARYRGGNVERTIVQATVFGRDNFTPVKLYQRYTRAEHLKSHAGNEDRNVLFYYLDKIVSPARLSGTTLLVHETIDQSKEHRRAWVYSQAHRRVRRAPSVGYDAPVPGTYGLKTADSYDMFNGSPDKYHWQYHGKQELYIPYNAYRLASKDLKYKNILNASTINPEHMRWELHRVHKIEATLKSGRRHIYAKRIFYLDEDTWTIVLAEQYDNRGELWRVSEGHMFNYYDRDLPYFAMEVTYDIISNQYNVFGLSNEESQSYTFQKKFKQSDYVPSSLRRNSRG